MITNNDEKQLANCLNNLKKVVDEIIIVDIGSNDQTVEIAKQAGAIVSEMIWKNNYSEAKNLCLDQAKGRWVLFFQANEMINPEQLNRIIPLLDNPNVEGYLFYIDYHSKKYRISSPVQSLRLFRNRNDYRYQYKAAERISDQILTNIKDAGIQIVQQSDVRLPRDNDSLTLLLQEELKEQPEDSYLQYMYGIELLNERRYKESSESFQKSRKNVNVGSLFAPHLFKCSTLSLISLQRHQDALDVLNEGIKYFSFYSDLLVLRGELRKQDQRYQEAIEDLKNSLKIIEQPNSRVPRPEITSSIILETLAETHEQVFNYQQALDCYRQAYQLNKTNQKLLYKIGELGNKVGSTELLEELLKEAIEKNQLEQLMIIMDILFQNREYSQVLAHMEYLEKLLGKGEQIESIKFFCYMMLGRWAEAELYFLAINKESPLYSLLLPQRIESFWFQNEWQEAQQLIKEMDQNENIDQPTKAIYHLLHGLLTGEELSYVPLTEQEYEIVNSLLENLLWLEEKEKAQILLPLLLQGQKEEQYIRLAELWAVRNDFQTLEMIFQSISSKQKQLQFKQKIIYGLLRHGHIEVAQKLMKLGEAQPLGALEPVLLSKSFMKKLEESIAKLQHRITEDAVAGTLSEHTPTKPSKALLAFYQSLRIVENNVTGSTLENQAAEITCTKIHQEIGQIFEKAQKKQEALSAYLRALQWDPHNELAQKKISDLFAENSSQFDAFLEGKGWILEGDLFRCQESFIYFIQGILQFKNQQFEQALAMFSQSTKDEPSDQIAFPYMISSLWLSGKEAEALRWLDKYSKSADVFPIFFRICQSDVLKRLKEAQQQYPFSELIIAEMKRIKNRSYFNTYKRE